MQIDPLPTQHHRAVSITLERTPSARGRSNQQPLQERRALYRRSNTLATLPVGLLPVVTSSNADRGRLAPIKDSPVHESSTVLNFGTIEPDQRTSRRFAEGGSGGTGSSRASGDGLTTSGRRSTFFRKASCNDLLLTGFRNKTTASGDVTPTGSSLLAKVRDRIRDTVMATEWSAAIVLEERRHRAAEQYDVVAARSRLQQQHSGGSSRRVSPVDLAIDHHQQHQRHHSPTSLTTPTAINR